MNLTYDTFQLNVRFDYKAYSDVVPITFCTGCWNLSGEYQEFTYFVDEMQATSCDIVNTD